MIDMKELKKDVFCIDTPDGFTSGCIKLDKEKYNGICVHLPPNRKFNDPIKIQETCPFYVSCIGHNFKRVIS